LVAGPKEINAMKRVPPSVRLKEEIDGLLHGSTATEAEKSTMVGFVGRLARYMLQVAIEAEATAFLGREHYRRGILSSASLRSGRGKGWPFARFKTAVRNRRSSGPA
jgi:hypothetical protein